MAGIALVLVTLTAVLTSAQLNLITPLDPVRGSPQSVKPILLWVIGDWGNTESNEQGNQTDYGHTILLNSITSTNNATATWSLQFPVAFDLAGKPVIVTAWLPAFNPSSGGTTPLIYDSSNSTPIELSVGSHHLLYQPISTLSVSWNPSPLYTANFSDAQLLPQLYANFTGAYRYIPLSFNSASIESTITFSITVPPKSEVWVPNVIISVAPSGSNSNTASQLTGLEVLPIFGIGILFAYLIFRKFFVRALARTLFFGIAFQIAIAPFFLHTDLVTLQQYPSLLYGYGIINLQSMVYGPLYYVDVTISPAPLYAAGILPTSNVLNVLFKLTPILFDGLTFLTLYNLLTRRIGHYRAYYWSTVCWLFNPLVIWVSAVHGLAESAGSFFILLAIYEIENSGAIKSRLAATISILVLSPTALILIPLSSIRKSNLRMLVLSILLPALSFVALFLALYHSLSPLVDYLSNLFLTNKSQSFSAYGNLVTSQSVWAFPAEYLGLYPDLAVFGAIIVVLFFIVRYWRGGISIATVPAMTYATFILFYAAYANFSVQLLLWILPAGIIILTAKHIAFEKALLYFFIVSLVGLLVEILTFQTGRVDSVLALLLFTLLTAPAIAQLTSASQPYLQGLVEFLAIICIGTSVLIFCANLSYFRYNPQEADYVLLLIMGQSLFFINSWNSKKRGVAILRTLSLPLAVMTFSALSMLYYMQPGMNAGLSYPGYALALIATAIVLAQVAWGSSLWLRIGVANPRRF